ncbi:aldolase [Rubrobacter xylanophilus]|uniref:Aldolase n=1 Tax=Rubrobacter xylanophilus TaxID=49319 RepID=A0A510HGT8_9ACTN|nr:class II aldolase/adducin family protein [Rubrobacter xylanophilus]BBL79159.1 aldolase [Rubrobacter xylanophilus]
MGAADGKLREEIAEVCRRMSGSGLVVGTSGNVSARTEDGNLLITPSGLDYAVLEPGDVVLVDPEGQVLEGDLLPSVETPMHAGIYRSRPDVAGIVHTHARFCTTLACLGWEIPPVHYMLAVLSDEGRIPLARYATYGTAELAANAVEALGSTHRACLLRNHGTIAVGVSPKEAYARTELLEEMAEVYYRARLAGEPVLLRPEQLAEVSAKIHDYGQSKPSPR